MTEKKQAKDRRAQNAKRAEETPCNPQSATPVEEGTTRPVVFLWRPVVFPFGRLLGVAPTGKGGVLVGVCL